jgi:hypothetical protein
MAVFAEDEKIYRIKSEGKMKISLDKFCDGDSFIFDFIPAISISWEREVSTIYAIDWLFWRLQLEVE